MSNAFFQVPTPVNEPVKGYAPGSPEREEIVKMYQSLGEQMLDLPMYIGSETVRTGNKIEIRAPHQHAKVLGHFHRGDRSHVHQAIDAALEARKKWANTPWQDRAAIFLKAADLLSGPYRSLMNAATMWGQSKNVHQAEIDAACELADFWRFNVQYMTDLYRQQPGSQAGIWNRMEYRPLEGFVFAITPFNFTSIAANLPGAPVLMGNVAVWKPADTQIYSADIVMRIYREAGLPDGVINLIYVDGPEAGEVVFDHPDFAGLHFTGSTGVFKQLWKTIGSKIDRYKTYPRIVGETGGKDFVVAHPSSDPLAVATALSRGAFEYQGQKCSAASRAYLPESLWSAIEDRLKADLSSFKMGDPGDLSNFVNAVIDERAFDKICGYIEYAKNSPEAEIVSGGVCDKSRGWFIQPTVVKTTNPHFKSMVEEIFGPVLTIYVYPDANWKEVLTLIDQTSEYALTGAVFSRDRYAALEAVDALQNAAGNFYINDKPTGAVVGQQPFGGARGSGTNDKAGSMMNLLRWVSARTIKETLVPPTDFRYPFLG